MAADISVNRRRSRRISLDARLTVRKPNGEASELSGIVTNVSLDGAYFIVESDALAPGDTIVASMSVPLTGQRDFPFSRITGPGQVVRVDRLSRESGTAQRFGVAVAFASDAARLMAVPE